MKFLRINTFLFALETYCVLSAGILRRTGALPAIIKSTRQSSTQLHDNMSDTSSSSGDIHYFDEVTSTMDKAKEILLASKSPRGEGPFAVVAEYQSKGRGTRGRTWVSGSNNMFMTISLPLTTLPITLTLFPLRIGTIIHPAIQSRVQTLEPVKLKWPNDVVIGDKKVCGILIEIDNNRLLVGIGCNVASAPPVAATGADFGRPSTCLAQHNTDIASCPADIAVPPHHALAQEIFGGIKDWYHHGTQDTDGRVVSEFESVMYYAQQRLRDGSPPAADGTITAGQEVVPIGLNRDGTLQVRKVNGDANGEQMTLIADYLV